MIIVLAGIDGAGKTTTGRLLTQRLNAAHYPATFAKNRSGRRSLYTCSARHNIRPPVMVFETIETAIRCVNVLISHCRATFGPRTVIMDRYLYCQVALRRARGLLSGWLLPFLSKILPTPDIIFYFAIPADLAHARIERRATDSEALGHLEAFDAAYREMENFPSFVVIDAALPSGRIVEEMLRELGLCEVVLQ